MSETLPEPQRISFFFIAIISVLLILSFISLYQVVEVYRNTGKSPDYLTIILSVSPIAILSYMVLQMRKKPLKLDFETPKVFTTTKCSSCDFKNVRGFQNGEYILKAIEACPKCNSHMFISSIYGETEEKKE
jgi:hypothetical protein